MSRKNSSSYIPAFILSVGLHLLFIIALIWGAKLELFKKTIKPPIGNSINAVIMDVNPINQYNNQQALKRKQAQEAQAKADAIVAKANKDRVEKLKQQQAEQQAKQEALDKEKEQKILKEKSAAAAKIKAEQEIQAARLKAQADADAEKLRIDAETKQKEQEAQTKKIEENRAKQEAIAKATKDKAAKDKAVADKAKKDKENKSKNTTKTIDAKKANEAQMHAEATKELESLSDDMLFGGDATGTSSDVAQGIDSSVNSNIIGTEVDKYLSMYQRIIEQHLISNSSFNGKSCQVILNLTSSGQVIKAEKPVGDPALCDATLSAISKIDAFPMPKDNPELVKKLRSIRLTTKI